MRTILFIIQKEFKQIMRDKFMGKAIIIMPILQMLILVYAATFEIKNIDLLIVDRDGSTLSTGLVQKYISSDFFSVTKENYSDKQIKEYVDRGKADLALIIPDGLEKDFRNREQVSTQVIVDAVNGSAGELALGYTRAIIMNFNQEILTQMVGPIAINKSVINVSSRFWYNPLLDYKIYMAPGILVVLITAIGWFMTGMNLVKEKESGTIEQLNVSPIKKYQFILGKLIPFLVIGLADLAFGLVLAKILFSVPFEGSLLTLFSFSFVYLIAILGIGLMISTISSTQQQVLFVSFFFVMIFILMSGLFTPLENMPRWGQMINWFNPVAYYCKVIRMVLLKGSTILDIRNDIFIMFGFAITTNLLAVWRYRKTA